MLCLCVLCVVRLMSGMKASISTHIAKKYLFKTALTHENVFDASGYTQGEWGVNMPLYYSAVGNHPDRLNNMYFAFLFLLRAVVRAGDCLTNYPYHTGNATEDLIVSQLIKKLVHSEETSAVAAAGIDALTLQGTGETGQNDLMKGEYSALFHAPEEVVEAVEECKYGFDETELFQVVIRTVMRVYKFVLML